MDWQQITALGIVVGTAGMFLWARWRRRQPGKLPCYSGCGCSSSSAPRETVTYRARKGQRPEIIVKQH
jgi:hypothetical protein